MNIEPQEIPEVLLITPKKFGDDRGFFSELYRAAPLAEHNVPGMVQHNLSRSTKGVLRGLHYQLSDAPLGKLVRCLAGSIFDVAVDIRQGSPSYGQWVGVELDAQSLRALYVPEGFAHGFCATSETADVLYMQTGYYSPQHERSIRWDDPSLEVKWPVTKPTLSGKDADAPRLADAENDFVYSQPHST
ncbi:MAG: dTDP-4-dehydrorhamnose 3,5-epimerase [Myxococcota bacterium]